MAIQKVLADRSNNECELCNQNTTLLEAYAIPPKGDDSPDNQIVACNTCLEKINANDYNDADYWRFTSGTIWSEVPAVQTMSYKILTKLKESDWARETLESVFLEDNIKEWANAEDELAQEPHKDCYGALLEAGDNVVLTQNLNVKGTSFTAQNGTVVKNIRLVRDNSEQIEGKVNGSTIVILTKYVKKGS